MNGSLDGGVSTSREKIPPIGALRLTSRGHQCVSSTEAAGGDHLGGHTWERRKGGRGTEQVRVHSREWGVSPLYWVFCQCRGEGLRIWPRPPMWRSGSRGEDRHQAQPHPWNTLPLHQIWHHTVALTKPVRSHLRAEVGPALAWCQREGLPEALPRGVKAFYGAFTTEAEAVHSDCLGQTAWLEKPRTGPVTLCYQCTSPVLLHFAW